MSRVPVRSLLGSLAMRTLLCLLIPVLFLSASSLRGGAGRRFHDLSLLQTLRVPAHHQSAEVGVTELARIHGFTKGTGIAPKASPVILHLPAPALNDTDKQLSSTMLIITPSDTGAVHAVDQHGNQRWGFASAAATGGIQASPAVLVLGRRQKHHAIVYVATLGGWVYALDAATGHVRWEVRLGISIACTPAVQPILSGRAWLYVIVNHPFPRVIGVSDKPPGRGSTVAPRAALVTLDAMTGEVIQPTPSTPAPPSLSSSSNSFETMSGESSSSINLGSASGGTLIAGASDGVYAFTPTTTTPPAAVWKFSLRGGVSGPVAVVEDTPHLGDIAVFGGADWHVYCVSLVSGRRIWSYRTRGRIQGGPAVDVRRGVVYIGSDDRRLYTLDLITGRRLWTVKTGNWVIGSPVATRDLVVFGSSDGHLYVTLSLRMLEMLTNGCTVSHTDVLCGVSLSIYFCLSLPLSSRYGVHAHGTAQAGKVAFRFMKGPTGQITSTPAVSSEGILVFVSRSYQRTHKNNGCSGRCVSEGSLHILQMSHLLGSLVLPLAISSLDGGTVREADRSSKLSDTRLEEVDATAGGAQDVAMTSETDGETTGVADNTGNTGTIGNGHIGPVDVDDSLLVLTMSDASDVPPLAEVQDMRTEDSHASHLHRMVPVLIRRNCPGGQCSATRASSVSRSFASTTSATAPPSAATSSASTSPYPLPSHPSSQPLTAAAPTNTLKLLRGLPKLQAPTITELVQIYHSYLINSNVDASMQARLRPVCDKSCLGKFSAFVQQRRLGHRRGKRGGLSSSQREKKRYDATTGNGTSNSGRRDGHASGNSDSESGSGSDGDGAMWSTYNRLTTAVSAGVKNNIWEYLERFVETAGQLPSTHPGHMLRHFVSGRQVSTWLDPGGVVRRFMGAQAERSALKTLWVNSAGYHTRLHDDHMSNVVLQLTGVKRWTIVSPRYHHRCRPMSTPNGRGNRNFGVIGFGPTRGAAGPEGDVPYQVC